MRPSETLSFAIKIYKEEEEKVKDFLKKSTPLMQTEYDGLRFAGFFKNILIFAVVWVTANIFIAGVLNWIFF